MHFSVVVVVRLDIFLSLNNLPSPKWSLCIHFLLSSIVTIISIYVCMHCKTYPKLKPRWIADCHAYKSNINFNSSCVRQASLSIKTGSSRVWVVSHYFLYVDRDLYWNVRGTFSRRSLMHFTCYLETTVATKAILRFVQMFIINTILLWENIFLQIENL